jgi:hypothetical protein
MISVSILSYELRTYSELRTRLAPDNSWQYSSSGLVPQRFNWVDGGGSARRVEC